MSSNAENGENSKAKSSNTGVQTDNLLISENEVCKLEWQCFLLIILILFPIVSLSLIGLYGFLVWMGQIFIFGPPGADDCGV